MNEKEELLLVFNIDCISLIVKGDAKQRKTFSRWDASAGADRSDLRAKATRAVQTFD